MPVEMRRGLRDDRRAIDLRRIFWRLYGSAVYVVVLCGPNFKFVWGDALEACIQLVQFVVDPPFFDDFPA